MQNKATDRQLSAGFTVVETLIVLAVAGLILSITLLAIPALIRNSRNNQRKQDVQTVLETVSHYELRNSGNIPTTAQLKTDILAYHHLTYYDATSATNIQVTTKVLGQSLSSMPSITSLDQIMIYNHARCDTATLGKAINTGAGYNDIVALYAIEAGNGHQSMCQQL